MGRDILEPELGVDFDWKNDPRAGEPGYIPEWVIAFLNQMPLTYAEWSPSLKGIHLWYVVSSGHDKLPSAAAKNFEVYSRDRFFTLTFNSIPYSAATIACISYEQAMSIFTLAGYEEKSAVVTNGDGEPGWWSVESLGAVLQMMVDSTPDFQFRPYGSSRFAVNCPGDSEDGWFDGIKHSYVSGLGHDALVWINNGWPCFRCLHAHCTDPKKTWGDLCDHFLIDANELWEAWLESGVWNAHAKELPHGTY